MDKSKFLEIYRHLTIAADLLRGMGLHGSERKIRLERASIEQAYQTEILNSKEPTP